MQGTQQLYIFFFLLFRTIWNRFGFETLQSYRHLVIWWCSGLSNRTIIHDSLETFPLQVRLWLSELSGDISIWWAESAPHLVGIGSRWLPKLGGDQSPCPHAHRRACFGSAAGALYFWCPPQQRKYRAHAIKVKIALATVTGITFQVT